MFDDGRQDSEWNALLQCSSDMVRDEDKEEFDADATFDDVMATLI